MDNNVSDDSLEALIQNCENEALHLTGHIQPIGYMLVAEAETLTIVAVSQNIASLLDMSVDSLLGSSLSMLPGLPDRVLFTVGVAPGSRQHEWYRTMHGQQVHIRSIRSASHLVIEIEPVRSEQPAVVDLASQIVLQPEEGEPWQDDDYWQRLLNGLLDTLPFERAVLYRFAEDFSGEVVAEAALDGSQKYFGLKFPASDIPEIARKMYFENPSRLIADVNGSPVPLVSHEDEPADLSWSDLRSVSPVHIRYLNNMGVVTSYSIPLIIAGRLWGLVSFHHSEALLPDARDRYDAEQLVKRFCGIYATFLSKRKLSMLRLFDDRMAGILSQMTLFDDAAAANRFFLNELMMWFDASATALVVNDTWYLSEHAGPMLNDIQKIDSVYRRDVSDFLLTTQNIAGLPELTTVTKPACRGMLTIRVNYERHSPRLYVFRPPESQVTHWAGKPEKVIDTERGALSPRNSFAKWEQVKGNESLPWLSSDTLFAKKIRVGMVQLVNNAFEGWGVSRE
ncbi:GAF domain-containing protein [Alteromonas sp. CYL-A6]|uniref:GAF domain-containing protein n=1 Tax=Alteromonas nitratireducens TaxID=3390813 RepID=UPI0034B20FB0